MKFQTKCGQVSDVVAGWAVRTDDGRTVFLSGISRAGAMRIADGKNGVIWVRQFSRNGDTFTILA